MKISILTLAIFLVACAHSSAQRLLRVGTMSPLSEIPLAYPRSISPDGTVIVGEELGSDNQFSWTEADGFIKLDYARVYAVESSDPRIYLGTDDDGPFRVVDGVPQPPVVNDVVELDDRFSAVFTTEGVWETVESPSLTMVTDVSGGGTIFVGNNFSGSHSRAAIWTKDTEFLIPQLETVIPQNVRSDHSEALGISADGSTVVGYEVVWYQGDDYYLAWIWTEERGIIPVLTLLEELEIEFDPRWAFEAATAVSADGSKIVGHGFMGGEEADEIWLLELTQNKIVVNDDRDLQDADPDDELIDVDLEMPGEQITLRAAIDFTNERPGKDRIEFDIPGDGVPTIEVGLPPEGTNIMTTGSDGDIFPLPAKIDHKSTFLILSSLKTTEPVEINGTTQTGGWVEISGFFGPREGGGEQPDKPNLVNGLEIAGGNSEVRGLIINKFPGIGLVITEKRNNWITGNRIGTNKQGDQANANYNLRTIANSDEISFGDFYGGGILVTTEDNLIGGTNSGEGNLISNIVSDQTIADFQMSSYGGDLTFSGSRSKNNVVSGNFIGTDSSGEIPISTDVGRYATYNKGIIIKNGASNITIGGESTSEKNTISDIWVMNNAQGVRILGNHIGVNATGTRKLETPEGIGEMGKIFILDSSDTLIKNNLIKGRFFGAIEIHDSFDIAVEGNRIGVFANEIHMQNESLRQIFIGDSKKVKIGGDLANEANTIGYPTLGRAKLLISRESKEQIEFSGNNIVSFDGLNTSSDGIIIDLEWDELDSIDYGDLDEKQNYPRLAFVTEEDSKLRFEGNLDSHLLGASYYIDIYRTHSPLNSGHGGSSMTYIGRGVMETGLDGTGNFDIEISVSDFSYSDFFCATATPLEDGHTSEFSRNRRFNDNLLKEVNRAAYGDRNGDGIDDVDQGNVVSFSASNGSATTLEVAVAGTLENVVPETQGSMSAPDGYSYPNGTVTFEVPNLSSGGSVAIRLILAEGAFVDTVWILKADDTWTSALPAGIAQNEISLIITDGGDGDRDGLANGRIVAAIGPGFALSPLPPMQVQVDRTTTFGMELSWPAIYQNAQVEYSPNLSEGAWQPVDRIPTFDDDRQSIFLAFPPPESSDAGFYRVRYNRE